MRPEYECPECGEHSFDITVTQQATVDFHDDGECEVGDISGDTEWHDESSATCLSCGYAGTLGEMTGKEDDGKD